MKRSSEAGSSAPDRFVRTDTTLRDLIRFAFNVQEFQIEGGPIWRSSNRFEINAKAATMPSSQDAMRALVRHLLEERFGLRTRTESRVMSMYELVTARDGTLGKKLRARRSIARRRSHRAPRRLTASPVAISGSARRWSREAPASPASTR
jgi:uncharacterized protein (TIGR03435 family)